MPDILCSRCGQEKEAVSDTAFYSGETGALLKSNACADCWEEWLGMQIMIINEYRLNLADPKSGDFLNEQALAFFKIGDSGPPAKVDYVPPAA